MISIVIGKPGTGKSYHCTRYLANYIETLAKKKQLERRIFTNLSVNIDAFQKYFDRRRVKVNVAEILIPIDGSTLKYDEELLAPGEKRTVKRGNKEFLEISPSSQAFFWNRFPDNALIIIDEIQKYLSNIKEVGDSEEQSLVEYFSLHRHKKHDWIFLTQNLMSLSLSVRRVSEKVVECLNTKQLCLPFPISIPLRDFQTLLLGFGIDNQIYRVREGRLDGSYRVQYDGPTEAIVMHKEIFDLYQTHTLLESENTVGIKTDSEVPFDLGRGAWLRALWWFTKKHWFHLTLKIIIAIILFKMFMGVFNTLKDQKKMVSLLGMGTMVEAPKDVPQRRAVISGRRQAADDELFISENSEFVDFDSDFIENTPIISRVIADGVVIENGISKETGSLTVDGRRIKAISPRYGVTYEKASDIYTRDFDELDRLRRWLRYQQRYNSGERENL